MVYVDDMHALAMGKVGRMKMSHMIADTPEELRAMAEKIGLRPGLIQRAGTWAKHFDVSKRMRQRAVELGAREVTRRELGVICSSKKKSRFIAPRGLYL